MARGAWEAGMETTLSLDGGRHEGDRIAWRWVTEMVRATAPLVTKVRREAGRHSGDVGLGATEREVALWVGGERG
jgi:hypothetical protein